MKFSNRKSDESVDKRVQFLLDSIYEKEGFRCKRPNDEKIDKRGVDIMLHSPNTDSILWVDEKCATHYWDRNLDTFSCELTCNRTKDHLGWFAQERNGYSATTHYMFVWVRALEKELVHISSLELALINKHDLQTYFRLSADCNADTPTSEVITKLFGQNPVVEVNKNLKVRKCEIFPEFPVNAIFSKELLLDMAIWSKTYDRFEVRDAIVAHKAKLFKEREEFQKRARKEKTTSLGMNTLWELQNSRQCEAKTRTVRLAHVLYGTIKFYPLVITECPSDVVTTLCLGGEKVKISILNTCMYVTRS